MTVGIAPLQWLFTLCHTFGKIFSKLCALTKNSFSHCIEVLCTLKLKCSYMVNFVKHAVQKFDACALLASIINLKVLQGKISLHRQPKNVAACCQCQCQQLAVSEVQQRRHSYTHSNIAKSHIFVFTKETKQKKGMPMC